MSVLSAKILWLADAAAAISSFLDDAETEQSGKDWEKSDADSMDRKRSAVEIFLTMENGKYVDNQEFMPCKMTYFCWPFKIAEMDRKMLSNESPKSLT